MQLIIDAEMIMKGYESILMKSIDSAKVDKSIVTRIILGLWWRVKKKKKKKKHAHNRIRNLTLAEGKKLNIVYRAWLLLILFTERWLLSTKRANLVSPRTKPAGV